MPLNQNAVERFNKIRAKAEDPATPENERMICEGKLGEMEREFPGIRQVADVMDGRLPGGRKGTAPRGAYPYPEPPQPTGAAEAAQAMAVEAFARALGLDPQRVRMAAGVAQQVMREAQAAVSADEITSQARISAELIHARRLTITVELPASALRALNDAPPTLVRAVAENLGELVAREAATRLS